MEIAAARHRARIVMNFKWGNLGGFFPHISFPRNGEKQENTEDECLVHLLSKLRDSAVNNTTSIPSFTR